MAQNLTKARFTALSYEGSESYEQTERVVDCQFNPTELATSKGAKYAEISIPGIDSPILQFVGGQNERMSVNLFFDESTPDELGNFTPVTDRTNKFFNLVKMSGEDHAPPRLLFQWGERFPGHHAGSKNAEEITPREGFVCVVESVDQNFTHFSPDGVPLRARLSVGLREYRTLSEQLEALNLQSADHTRTHTVKQGESLPGIAHKAYGDVGKWRLIAQSNGLLDVRGVAVGTVLTLPPVEE